MSHLRLLIHICVPFIGTASERLHKIHLLIPFARTTRGEIALPRFSQVGNYLLKTRIFVFFPPSLSLSLSAALKLPGYPRFSFKGIQRPITAAAGEINYFLAPLF